VDAQLLYQMNPGLNARLGMAAYYAEGVRLYVAARFVPFAVEFPENGSCHTVFQLMAVRISQFGNILRALAPEAGLERKDIQFILFKTRSRIRYLQFLLRGLLEARMRVPGVELLHAREARCRALPETGEGARRIYAEADGELLGEMPVHISLIPDGITLLAPRK
jgi:diacylglycerol kinase family enzyme